MRKRGFVAVLFPLLCHLTAQTQSTKKDVFDEVASEPKAIVWDVADPRCKVIYNDGVPHEQLLADGILISVYKPSLYDKHTNSIMVSVYDGEAGEIDVDPRRWMAQADDQARTLMPAIDADEKLAKDEHHTRRMQAVGNALAGFGAGMSQHTATVSNSDGSSSQVTYHDPADVREANANARDASLNTSSYYGRLSAGLFRRNTLNNKGFAMGNVYFNRPKNLSKHNQVDAVAVVVGGQIYIFPFDKGNIPGVK